MNCDPNSLMQAAGCFDKCIPHGMQRAVQSWLLCQIQQTGGTGLVDVQGQLQWTDDGVTTQLNLSGIRSLSQGLFINFGAGTITSVVAPDLVSSSMINLPGAAFLTSVSFPKLAHVTVGDLIVGPTLIADLTLPSLLDVAGIIVATSSPSLVNVSFPILTTTGQNIDFSGCSSLVSFSAPQWMPTDTFQIAFNGCALNVASVNAIIISANNALYGTLPAANALDLTGGTNAAPTGAAIAAKAAINARRAGACLTN